MNDLKGVVRHAERFGSDNVYATAKGYLSRLELPDLSLELQRIDRRWRMGKADQARLATGVRSLQDPGLAEVAA